VASPLWLWVQQGHWRGLLELRQQERYLLVQIALEPDLVVQTQLPALLR
jgi:hypothetical protein